MEANNSELERTLQAGLHGTPELRHEEKTRYLGEFRERVLRMLTKSQVGDPDIYPEIRAALQDRRAALMVIHGDISEHAMGKYRKLADELHKPYTVRHDADFTGETGLVVVSREAVDVENIQVEGRRERLLKLGLPEQLIDADGKAICKDCYSKLCAVAPEEAKLYRVIGRFSRFLGERCAAHE